MMMDNIGKIIIVRNVVFSDIRKGKYKLSHDVHYKRPCVIISESEDKKYVLPLSTTKNRSNTRSDYKINNDDVVRKTLKDKGCFVKLDSIFTVNQFFVNEVDELNELAYYKLLKNIINYYENINISCTDFDDIKDDVKKQIKTMKRNSYNENKKIKKNNKRRV